MTRIILLDDELESQMRIYLALRDKYRVEIAEDGHAVMAMVRKLQPDLLLLGLQPSSQWNDRRSGLQLIEKLKRKYKDLKIVTILDSRNHKLEREVLSKGADGFVVRPIRTRALLSQMKALEL